LRISNFSKNADITIAVANLEAISKMHLTPKGFVAPLKRDFTSNYMNIKE
jgi:hypothetical protein